MRELARKAQRVASPDARGGDAEPGTAPHPPQPLQPPAQRGNPAVDDAEPRAARQPQLSPGAAGPSGQVPETPAPADPHAAQPAPLSAPPAPATAPEEPSVHNARRRATYDAAKAAEAAADAAMDTERRRSARLASGSAPAEAAAPEPTMAVRTMREYARYAMEYMETLATPRGAAGPSIELLDDLHRAVSERLAREHERCSARRGAGTALQRAPGW